MQEAETSSELAFEKWDLAIVGNSLDDRGRSATTFAGVNAARLLRIEYDAADFMLAIDGRRVEADALENSLGTLKPRTVLLETTTLGFVETLLCCRALAGLLGRVSLLYVEPDQYARARRSTILERRDFELSDEVPGYKAIPGATVLLSDRTPHRAVFFLGYEEQRLERALEDYQMLRPSRCAVVFGVPAFKPGWEMDAFANNIRVIRERSVRGGVHFCGAENPAAAFAVLERVRASLAGGERMCVAPIGTKPCGVGVALFVAEHADVGVLYDHPKRRAGRTTLVGRWHLYDASFETAS